MKRLFSMVLVIVLLMTLLPYKAYATTNVQISENVIYLDDGSYIIVELTWMEGRASGTKTGSKTHRFYNSDGVEQWRAVLRGTFTYTGSSATCTASSCDVTISDSSYYVVSKNVSKSGNAALCTLVMGKKFLGITIDKDTVNMSITCDANGNLS